MYMHIVSSFTSYNIANTETNAEIVDLTSVTNMSSTITTPSSVSSLSSPVKKQDKVQKGEQEDHHLSIDPLTMEMEVQDLIDRVTILEEGHQHILEVQSSILCNQEEIFSRLTALEKHHQASSFKMSAWYTQDEACYEDTGTARDLSMDEDDYMVRSVYIPPPPVQHLPPPPHHPLAPCNPHPPAPRDPHPLPHPPAPRDPNPPPHPQAPCDPHPPPHSPPHPPAVAMHLQNPYHPTTAKAAVNLSPHTPPSHPPPAPHIRTPFRELYPFNVTVGQSGRKPAQASLPSSAINKKKLLPPKTVIQNNQSLMCPSKVPTLALKLAKESFFGEDVMARCTFAGTRELPALPTTEKNHLKHLLLSLFPQYWRSPHEFEPVWNACINSIGQGCNRLRRSGKISI